MVVKIILFFLVLGLVMSNASGIMRMMHESASLKKNLHLYKKVQLNIRSIFFLENVKDDRRKSWCHFNSPC